MKFRYIYIQVHSTAMIHGTCVLNGNNNTYNTVTYAIGLHTKIQTDNNYIL